MLTTSLYNQAGENIGTIDLNPTLFDVPLNTALLHEAVVAQEANARVAIADTKGKGEVSGGGKKPWKQKGTGRARHGSSRSPIWKGGGVTFGPTSLRNFAKKFNKKARRAALASALSDAVRGENFFVIDSLVLPDFKTKPLSALLATLPQAQNQTLVLVEEQNTGVGVAANNLKNVDVMPIHCLNIKAVLKARRIIISSEALERMTILFGKKR